jgi:hypothetical protein
LFILFITISVCDLNGQVGKVKKESKELMSFTPEWYEGVVTLKDGSNLKGLVKFDSKNGVLSYQNGDDSRSFTPRSAVSFKFHDDAVGHDRVFYSFDYPDPDLKFSKFYFFESVRQYKNFAILSKTDPIEVEINNRSHTYNNELAQTVDISQTSTIFLMDETGKLTPYIRQIMGRKSSDKFLRANEAKNKIVAKKDILADYVGDEMFERLKLYAKENDLNFKFKDEFLQVLRYYDQIVKE